MDNPKLSLKSATSITPCIMAKQSPRPTFTRRTAASAQDVKAFVEGAEGPSPTPQAGPSRLQRVRRSKTVTFNLRCPKDLHDDLKFLAEETGMSMHEICLTLLAPALKEERNRLK